MVKNKLLVKYQILYIKRFINSFALGQVTVWHIFWSLLEKKKYHAMATWKYLLKIMLVNISTEENPWT